MRKARCLQGFLLGGLLCSLSFAAEPETAGPLRLEGKVVDEQSGMGIAKSRVVIQGGSSPLLVATDAEGAFVCSRIIPGTYRVIVVHPQYRSPAPVTVQVPQGQKGSVPLLLRMKSKAAWKAALEKLAAVEGRVTAASQAPPKPVAVFIVDAQGKAVNGRITEADGTYQIREIPPGIYTVRVNPFGLADFTLPEKERQHQVILRERQTVRGIHFNFVPLKRLPEIAAEPGVEVQAGRSISGIDLKPPPTTAEERLAADPAFQKVSSFAGQMGKRIQDPITLRRMGGPAKRELPAGARLEGEVLDGRGKPAAGAIVVLLDSRKEPALDFMVKVTLEGRFVMEGVPDGSYYLQAGADPKRETAPEPLKVTRGKADREIRLTLP